MRMHTGAQNGGKYTRNSYHIGQMPTGSAAIDCGSRESVIYLILTNTFGQLSVPVEEQRKSTLCIYRKSIICPTQVTDTVEAKSERLPIRKCWNYSARPRIGANCV